MLRRRLLAAAGSCVLASGLAVAGPLVPRALPFRVRLTTVAAVDADVSRVMAEEASQIWDHAGVRIEWLSAATSSSEPASVHVVVVSRSGVPSNREHTWPVAELRVDADAKPIALVSLDAASRVVAQGAPHGEPEARWRRRLGLVLGRAVAHELGHHVLGGGHSAHGLMRARIAASDFSDVRDGLFIFDQGSRRRIAQALGAPAAPTLARMQSRH